MEHIVQFGISIDDDQIKKTIENNVRSQVLAEIKKDCMKQLIGNDNASAYQYSQKIKDMVNDNIKSFLEENKETIIKEAVNQLAEKLSRTKAAKEALSKTIRDMF